MNTQFFRDAFFLARMDVRHMLRARETLLWTFVMPVIFIFFIGSISGNSVRRPERKDPLAVRSAADAGFLARRLIAQLEQQDYAVWTPKSDAEWTGAERRLEVPGDFTASLLAGSRSSVAFRKLGSDMGADFDRVRMNRAVVAVLGEMAVAGDRGAAITSERMEQVAAQPRNLTVDVKPAGKRIDFPTGFDQSVPGTMVMFTLMVLFTSGAVTLTIERNAGILRRLASSPMSRGSIVFGKWGARMALGMVQIAFAMVAGTLLFHMHWGPNLAAVAVVLAAYGALAAALGMLLGNFGRTEGQVIGIGVLASNLLAGLGGCWWPIEIAPPWSQKMAMLLPTGWTMDALHKLVSFGAPAASVLPHVAVTFAAAMVAGWAIARRFRFE